MICIRGDSQKRFFGVSPTSRGGCALIVVCPQKFAELFAVLVELTDEAHKDVCRFNFLSVKMKLKIIYFVSPNLILHCSQMFLSCVVKTLTINIKESEDTL